MKIICIYRTTGVRRALCIKKKAIGLTGQKIIPIYEGLKSVRSVLAPSAGMQKMPGEYGMRSRSAVFPTGLESRFAMDEQKAKDQEDV